MGNMIPIIVEESSTGIHGVLVIFAFVFTIYTIVSIHISNIRHEKLLHAKQLIEEGHQRMIDDKGEEGVDEK